MYAILSTQKQNSIILTFTQIKLACFPDVLNFIFHNSHPSILYRVRSPKFGKKLSWGRFYYRFVHPFCSSLNLLGNNFPPFQSSLYFTLIHTPVCLHSVWPLICKTTLRIISNIEHGMKERTQCLLFKALPTVMLKRMLES